MTEHTSETKIYISRILSFEWRLKYLFKRNKQIPQWMKWMCIISINNKNSGFISTSWKLFLYFLQLIKEEKKNMKHSGAKTERERERDGWLLSYVWLMPTNFGHCWVFWLFSCSTAQVINLQEKHQNDQLHCKLGVKDVTVRITQRTVWLKHNFRPLAGYGCEYSFQWLQFLTMS